MAVTCVQVPVLTGHSLSVRARFEAEADASHARETLEAAPGVVVVDDPAAPPQPVLTERGVRDLARVNGTVLAGAETGMFRSDDGGRTWQSSGVEGRQVWHMAPVPDAPHAIFAVTPPAGVIRPMWGSAGSAYQRFPSGPAVITA